MSTDPSLVSLTGLTLRQAQGKANLLRKLVFTLTLSLTKGEFGRSCFSGNL